MLTTLSAIFKPNKDRVDLVSRSIRQALFPIRCLSCGCLFHPRPHPDGGVLTSALSENGLPENGVNLFSVSISPFVCPGCLEHIEPVASPVCSVCGVMFPSREGEDHICQQCIESPVHYGRARAAGVYDRTLMKLIHSLKYKGKIQLADPLGMLLFFAFIRFWEQDSVDMVIPVPLHLKRFRSRGFNQAFLLIRNWRSFAESMEMELPRLEIRTDIMTRCRWTDPQTTLDRRQRKKNIAKAFRVTGKTMLRGKKILLVDDVYTTGATVNECARQLIRSGARQVDVLTLARTM